MIDNFSVAVFAFPMRMLILPLVDDILLPRHINWSTNLMAFNEERATFCLRLMNFVLSEFT